MASLEMAATSASVASQPRAQSKSTALALLAICVFINYIDRGNLSIAAPLLKTELGISASQLGILLSSFFWTYTACLFACGWFVDRLDVNRVLALGFLVWSLATAATGFVHGFATLLVVRMILGMGESVAFPSYAKILARHVPEHCRGFANGVIIAGMKLGPAAGTLGGGMLMTDYGWRPVFIGIGLVSLLWLPPWMKWRPHGELPTASPELRVSVTDIFRQQKFWATAAGGFCVAYPLYFTITWLPFYLVHEQNLAMGDMVHTAALFYIVDAAGAFATGWLADFLIRRGSGVGAVRKSAMALGWIIASAGFLGCAWAGLGSYLPWLMVTAVGLGIGNAGYWAFCQTLAGPQAVGRWGGLMNGFANLSGVICPALTGFTVDWTGHFHLAIAITAGVCALSAMVWIFFLGELKQVDWAHLNRHQPLGSQ
jgi:ACS family D-galactonate transporter-like MFS transporter